MVNTDPVSLGGFPCLPPSGIQGTGQVQLPGSCQPSKTFSLQGDQLNLKMLTRSVFPNIFIHKGFVWKRRHEDVLFRKVCRGAAKRTDILGLSGIDNPAQNLTLQGQRPSRASLKDATKLWREGTNSWWCEFLCKHLGVTGTCTVTVEFQQFRQLRELGVFSLEKRRFGVT